MKVSYAIIASLILSLVYMPLASSSNVDTYIVVLKDDVDSKNVASKVAEEHGLIIMSITML